MTNYIIRRLLQSVVVIILVSIIVFAVIRVLPGDPIYMLYGPNQVLRLTDEQIADIKHKAGLDKPMILQYVDWITDVVHGDLGQSIIYETKVSDAIAKRLPITFHLGILAFIVGLLLGASLGLISAIRRGTWLDTVVTLLANLGITIPVFWLGVMLIYVFALQLKVLPLMGYSSPFDDLWMSTKQLIMPVLCLSVFPVAGNARQTRAIMLEVLSQDYIRTAWSKGLRERVVVLRHALKNSLIPLLTFLGLGISTIVGGSVLIEMVFNIPGMGRLLVESIFKLDYPYVQGVTLVIAVVVTSSNLLIEIAYGWLDPRIRYT